MVLIEKNFIINEDVRIDNQNLIIVNNTVPLNITPDGVHDHSVNSINRALQTNGIRNLECIIDPNNPNNLLLRYTPPPQPQNRNRNGQQRPPRVDRNIQDFLNNHQVNIERLINDYINNNPAARLHQESTPKRPKPNDYFDANFRRVNNNTIEFPTLGLREQDTRNVINQIFGQNNNIRMNMLPGNIVSISYVHGIPDAQAEQVLDQIRRHSLATYNIDYTQYERARNMRNMTTNGLYTPDPNDPLMFNVRTNNMTQDEVENILRNQFSNNSLLRRMRGLPPVNPQPFNGIIDPVVGSQGEYNILFRSQEEAQQGLNAIQREFMNRNTNNLQGIRYGARRVQSFVVINAKSMFRKGVSVIKGNPIKSKIAGTVIGIYAATEMYNKFFSSANKMVRNQASIHEQNMNNLIKYLDNPNLSADVKEFIKLLIDQERELIIFLRDLPDELDSTIDKNQALSVYFKTMRDVLVNRRKHFIILSRSQTLNNDDKVFINECKIMLDKEDREFELQYKTVLIESGKLSDVDVSILPQAEKLSQRKQVVKIEQQKAETKSVWNYFSDSSGIKNFSILLGGSVIIYLLWKYKDKIKEKLVDLKNKFFSHNEEETQNDDKPAYD